jgi:hypothetical protein
MWSRKNGTLNKQASEELIFRKNFPQQSDVLKQYGYQFMGGKVTAVEAPGSEQAMQFSVAAI